MVLAREAVLSTDRRFEGASGEEGGRVPFDEDARTRFIGSRREVEEV